ncbi:putative ARF GTPase activator [Papiliotrema laurentii]|uniref:ARF GTPase activator n=1 Tax=Papiliotrema laurentii TaxID=5418 RepID=A0AAD9D2A8_PAPLA|nr:putative ARF GTPase activator [Papiliotrema laurentii]
MAENYQKKELLELMSNGANKLCVDCKAPSPQWASVSYGTFICLECSGIHRGFGVHISFIRSITMDKWSDEQVKKMKLGGNEKFKNFIESYGPEGGYAKGIGMNEKYNSWAAAQYREKLAAECADPPQPWSPSSPPADFGAPTRPASAQATRKARATGGSSSLNPSRTGTPISSETQGGSGNEAFFERLGNANASRPEHLPPSQGGRYAGFGSTPEPTLTSSHPSFSTSSHSVPTLDDFQQNPLGALSKGWGLFSSAVVSAGKEINTSVLQPGMSRAQQLAAEGGGEDWKKYINTVGSSAKTAADWAGQRANEGWDTLNHVAKERGGVDLNEQLERLGLNQKHDGDGYARLARAEDGVISPHGAGKKDDEDFFDSWDAPAASTPAQRPAAAGTAGKKAEKRDDWDKEDEWKDF